jgi:hypothetical protein
MDDGTISHISMKKGAPLLYHQQKTSNTSSSFITADYNKRIESNLHNS